MTKKILRTVGLLFAISTSAFAEGKQTLIEEVAIENSSSEYDIRIKCDWVDGTADKWLNVRHAEFGHRGVDRVYGLVLSALTNNKTLWVSYEGDKVLNVYLKKNRN